MQCSNCGHQNDGGKFCVKCGTKLGDNGAQQVAASVDSTPVQSNQATTYVQSEPVQQTQLNQHVENAKQISKLYLGYFMQGLKQPTAVAQGVRGEQFINGLITMILFAVSIPLMIYFGWEVILEKLVKSVSSGLFSGFDLDELGINDLGSNLAEMIELSFVDMVILKGLLFLLFVGAVALVTFGVIKLGKVDVSLQDVFARVGTFLIVPTAVLLIGLVFSLLKSEFFLYLLEFGLLGLFFVVPFTIYSFKKEHTHGFDGIYGTLLTYLVIVIFLFIISQGMIDDTKELISNAMRDAFNDLW
ncbi:zinc ribbon domain-containing protein [Priestia megaterium]|nr:zinc ribbon domain-containing protein [Priestia megaterium]